MQIVRSVLDLDHACFGKASLHLARGRGVDEAIPGADHKRRARDAVPFLPARDRYGVAQHPREHLDVEPRLPSIRDALQACRPYLGHAIVAEPLGEERPRR